MFLFSHMDREKEHLYIFFSCAFCGGFQSMEISISTSWVAEFRFFEGCKWSSVFSEFCPKPNRCLMSRHSFFNTINLSNLKLWTAISLKAFNRCVLKSRKSQSLQSVYCRSWMGAWLSMALWQTGESPFPQKDTVRLFLCGFSGILCSNKILTTYQPTAICRHGNYKWIDYQQQCYIMWS